jgi:hypothetical protein
MATTVASTAHSGLKLIAQGTGHGAPPVGPLSRTVLVRTIALSEVQVNPPAIAREDNCRFSKWAYDRRDQEPDVPLIYMAAQDPSDRGDVADDPLRKAFVRRWSPGVWESASAPHWMEDADPDLVVNNLERVIALAR